MSQKLTIMDPFILELLMDDPSPSVQEITQIAGMIVQNNIEQISQCSTIRKNHNLISKNTEATKLSYIEELVQNFSEKEFEEKLCMKRSTMEKLIHEIEVKFDKKGVNIDGMRISLEKKLCIFIWILANNDSYRKCADLFNVSKSSIPYIFHEICDILEEMRHDFIKWPEFEEQELIKDEILRKHSFPNCIGFIDACYIQIKGQTDSYTVVIQAVCDHNLIFHDVYLSETEECPTQIFKESALSNQINTLVHEENHLLGDISYDLLPRIMTPFKINKKSTNMERNYNRFHLEAWSHIKQAFSRLKNKFKRLKHLELNNIAEASKIICAACVVHNFILCNERLENGTEVPIPNDSILEFSGLSAEEKRHLLCSVLSQ